MKITETLDDNNILKPSKEILFSIKSFARSYSTCFSNNLNVEINWNVN